MCPSVLVFQVRFCQQRDKLLRNIQPRNIQLALSEGMLPLVKLGDFSVSKDMLHDVEGTNIVSLGCFKIVGS